MPKIGVFRAYIALFVLENVTRRKRDVSNFLTIRYQSRRFAGPTFKNGDGGRGDHLVSPFCFS
jgi:hypothetical protein